MRSPWVDLLFLHNHVTPAKLAWRPDARPCACKHEQVEVAEHQLPLHTDAHGPSTCCA